MQMQRKQQGFTLIELVAVIVVLGILASVALPKFFGLQAEARAAAVNAAKANLAGAANMAHAKMLVTNQMPSTFDGIGPITWSAHNPDGPAAGLIAGMNSNTPTGMGMMQTGVGASITSDWTFVAGGTTFGSASNTATSQVTLAADESAWLPKGVSTASSNANACYVKYKNASLSTAMNGSNQTVIDPVVTAVTTGCSYSGM